MARHAIGAAAFLLAMNATPSAWADEGERPGAYVLPILIGLFCILGGIFGEYFYVGEDGDGPRIDPRFARPAFVIVGLSIIAWSIFRWYPHLPAFHIADWQNFN